ncbi:nucleotidyltransferase domain-containing protein [Candidatus Woesearchaeota archaeon]|nr:nucleotidyltransferase domain-containing protein [Candidatus Woesearchaeota archaeon]
MSEKIDIATLYLSDYPLGFSGREIARRLKINHQTASLALKRMVKESFLKSHVEGRNIKYHLNFDDFKTKHLLSLAEDHRAQHFLQTFELKSVVSRILPYVDTIIIFGSFAKGLQKDGSDLDLVLIQSSSRSKIEEVFHLFPREINAHYATWKEFTSSFRQGNHLAFEIRKDHIIYGNILKLIGVYSGGGS